MEDQLLRLYDKVTELDKKSDVRHVEILSELKRIAETDVEQNKLLAEHARRCTALEADIQLRTSQLDARITPFEEKALKASRRRALLVKIGTGTIALLTALAGILKALR